jgi:FKBP-type peptidyl-prolyl cis-trans isomerase SlpA
MLNSPHPVVTEGAFLTLHYRLSADDGRDIVSTFGDTPATLQLGVGQLSPELEAKLIGLSEGTQHVFELPAGAAFGQRNPALIQRVSIWSISLHRVAGASQVFYWRWMITMRRLISTTRLLADR